MSLNLMPFGSSDTWLSKGNIDTYWPSRPSTSTDESISPTFPPVSFNANIPPPPLPLSSTWPGPLSLSIPPPSISTSQTWPSPSIPPPNLSYLSDLPPSTSPIWPESSTSSSLPNTISPDNTSPSRISPGSSTAGFGWNLDLSCQLAEKLMLVDDQEEEEEEEKKKDDSNQFDDAKQLAEQLMLVDMEEEEDEEEEEKDDEDLNKYEDTKQYGGDEDGSDDESTSANPRFKTEICRNIKEKGSCLYGDLCQFAHGKDEVRDVVKHNKYKTKLCQKYWIHGYCAYGPRCNFVHCEKDSSKGTKKSLPPTEAPSYLPPTGSLVRTVDDVINMATTDAVLLPNDVVIHKVKDIIVDDSGSKEVSVEDSGNSSLGSDSKSPTSSPRLVESPDNEGEFFTPIYGSGRLIAKQENNTFTWLDTWTQKYV